MATIMTSGYETSLQFKIAREQNIKTNKISVAAYEVNIFFLAFSNNEKRDNAQRAMFEEPLDKNTVFNV